MTLRTRCTLLSSSDLPDRSLTLVRGDVRLGNHLMSLMFGEAVGAKRGGDWGEVWLVGPWHVLCGVRVG
jgi:hypothetical protein